MLALGLSVGVGAHHQHAFVPIVLSIHTYAAHFVSLCQHLLPILGQHLGQTIPLRYSRLNPLRHLLRRLAYLC